jgi:PST family polysaccharide transporter
MAFDEGVANPVVEIERANDRAACKNQGSSLEGGGGSRSFDEHCAKDIKGKSVRGFVVSFGSQGVKIFVRTGGMIVMARLVSPEDFGLQGMVAAITGFMMVFRDCGLSMATVQRKEITHEQTSTLFWINVAIGALITLILVLLSPALSSFYREPRLNAVSMVMALTFLFNGFAIQHQALLQRQMRFVAIAISDNISLLISMAVGVCMAVSGYGYWALVGMAVSAPLTAAICLWIALPWRPGLPRRNAGVRQMLHFGGTITCNTLIVYVGYNIEKVLLGRFWGAEALGLYGRAYQLANLATEQLSSAITNVAFPAYARIQGEADRLKRAFLKSYSLLISLTIPCIVCCALFSEEIVQVLLGRKWNEAAPIFRLLSPVILALSLINPFGPLLQATGRVGRSLKMALVIAPVVIAGILMGLHHGPIGVATGYSSALMILVIPCVAWAKRGYGIDVWEYWKSIRDPLFAGVVACITGLAMKWALWDSIGVFLRLLIGVSITCLSYLLLLLFALGKKNEYAELIGLIFRKVRLAK